MEYWTPDLENSLVDDNKQLTFPWEFAIPSPAVDTTFTIRTLPHTPENKQVTFTIYTLPYPESIQVL